MYLSRWTTGLLAAATLALPVQAQQTADAPTAEAPSVEAAGDETAGDEAAGDEAAGEGVQEAAPVENETEEGDEEVAAPADDSASEASGSPTTAAAADAAPVDSAPSKAPPAPTDGTAEADAATDAAADAQAAPATKAPDPDADPSPEVCEAVLKKKAEADAAAAAAAEAERKKGFWWDKSLTLGATGLGVFNRAFVGQPDGFAATVGAFIKGNLTLGYAGHILENTLSVNEALLITPGGENLFKNPVPLFNKSADEVIAQSEYRFLWPRFPYVGPYARAKVQTRLLPTFLMRSDAQPLVFTNRDGTTRVTSTTAYQPTVFASFFEPTTFSEGAGVHIEPPTFLPWVSYSFKAGAQANHLVAGNGYVVADNPDTPEIELNQLSIVNSAGASAEAKVGGQVLENVVWNLSAAVYYPILALGGNVDQLSLLERTHVDAQGTVSFKLVEWLSLDTQARVLREPFILNDWQFQATALVTAGFNIF